MPVEGFPTEPEVYNAKWFTGPLEQSKILQYLAFERYVMLPRWDVPPLTTEQSRMRRREVRNLRNTHRYAIHHGIAEGASVTKVTESNTGRVTQKMGYDALMGKGIPPNSNWAHIIHQVVGLEQVSWNLIKYEEDEGQANIRLYEYPKDHLTMHVIPLEIDGKPRIRDIRWQRAQLCTNRLAMETYHKLLMDEAQMLLLPAPLDQLSEEEDPSDYFSTENEMLYFWATVTQENWEPDYRKVTVTHEHDDTVVAFFYKNFHHDDEELCVWEIVSESDFDEAAPKLDESRTAAWQLWVDKKDKSDSDSLLQGPGTIFIQRCDTGAAFVVDSKYILPNNQLRGEDALYGTFPEKEGTWRLAKVLSSRPGENNVEEPSVELWARVSDDNVILERLVAKKIHTENEEEASRSSRAYNHMTLNPRYHLLDPRPQTVWLQKEYMTEIRGYCRQHYRDVDHSFDDIAFLEYCPGGDLRTLIQEFKEQGRKIPEGFIWLLFWNLTQALTMIAKMGKIHPMVTLDNIFLRERPKEGRWRAYPSPVLGGLGNVEDLEDIARIGKIGYSTPEHIRAQNGLESGDSETPDDISSDGSELGPDYEAYLKRSRLHVYAVGICVRSAMRCEEGLPIDFHDDDHSLFDTMDDKSTYSTCLERAVARCLEHDPRERIPLLQLEHEISLGMDALRAIKPNIDNLPEDALPLQDRMPLKEDEFPEGARVIYDEEGREGLS